MLEHFLHEEKAGNNSKVMRFEQEPTSTADQRRPRDHTESTTGDQHELMGRLKTFFDREDTETVKLP